jgi:hypothetical protein
MINYTNIQTAFTELVGYKEEQEITLGRSDSGLLTVGRTYKILDYKATDNFINVGASANATGVIFVATGTTPTLWTNKSVLQDQLLVTSDSGLFVNDISGVDLVAVKKCIHINDDLTPSQTVTEYLESIFNPEVINLTNKFLQKSKTLLKNKELHKSQTTFNQISEDTEAQNGNFRGFLIQLDDSNTVINTIKNAIFQLTETDNFDIFIYDLTKKVALQTINVTYSTATDVLVKTLSDYVLQNTNSQTSKQFLIGVYEHNADIVSTSQLSATNEWYQYDFFESDYFNMIPIKIAKEYHNYNSISGTYDLPNINQICETSYSVFNLELTKESDYTNLIVKFKNNFAEALQYQLALRIISDCINTKNFNQVTESQINNWKGLQIFLDNKLNGYDFKDDKGNSGHFQGIIEQLIYDFEGLDNYVYRRRNLLSIY